MDRSSFDYLKWNKNLQSISFDNFTWKFGNEVSAVKLCKQEICENYLETLAGDIDCKNCNRRWNIVNLMDIPKKARFNAMNTQRICIIKKTMTQASAKN